LTDSQWDSPDYIVDAENGFFINMATPTEGEPGRFTPLDYSDTTFLAKFRQPKSYETPEGEIWRLYSKAVLIDGGKRLEVMVGYRLKAPSDPLATTPESLLGDVDAIVKSEADRVALTFSTPKRVARPPRSGFTGGFQIVDPNTNQVVEQGLWLPAFLPKGAQLPTPGFKFYIYEGSLYVAQTDTNGRLSATSLIEIGELWWILCLCGMGFLFTTISARALSRRFLRNYFAVTGLRVPSIEEAQRAGESQSVEFKRGLSDDENKAGSVEEELLKSIAAFANTNEGVIFIGVDDAGHVKGLRLDVKGKDRLELKIRQLVRSRIRPTPAIQFTFEEAGQLLIGNVVVARGEGVHVMGGVVYIRYGSSDVQAQPEDLIRILHDTF